MATKPTARTSIFNLDEDNELDVLEEQLDSEKLKKQQAKTNARRSGKERPLDQIVREIHSIDPVPVASLTAAPSEWNFYKEPDATTYAKLKASIKRMGMWQPIVVYETEASTEAEPAYIILAGHTRWRAFKELYEETGDAKFKSILAMVIPKRIGMWKYPSRIQEIIVDTNISRVLTATEKARSVLVKIKALRERGISEDDFNGRLQEEFGIGRSLAFEWAQYAKADDEMLAFIDAHDFNIKCANNLVALEPEAQKKLLAACGDKLTNGNLAKLNANARKNLDDFIASVLDNPDQKLRIEQFKYDQQSKRRPNDVPVMVLMPRKQLEAFKKLLQDNPEVGAYLVKTQNKKINVEP